MLDECLLYVSCPRLMINGENFTWKMTSTCRLASLIFLHAVCNARPKDNSFTTRRTYPSVALANNLHEVAFSFTHIVQILVHFSELINSAASHAISLVLERSVPISDTHSRIPLLLLQYRSHMDDVHELVDRVASWNGDTVELEEIMANLKHSPHLSLVPDVAKAILLKAPDRLSEHQFALCHVFVARGHTTNECERGQSDKRIRRATGHLTNLREASRHLTALGTLEHPLVKELVMEVANLRR